MNRTLIRSPRPRAILVVSGTVALAAVLAACGSGSAATASSSTSKAPASGSGRAARAGFGGGLDGAIASVGNGSFTVKPSSGDAATVNWTSSTAFTKTASGTVADVTTGACVSVTEASGSDASTGSVDATAVRITPPDNGTCSRAAGGFGGGGAFPGRSGSRPSGSRPSGGFGGGSRPSGASGGAGFGSMLFGSVASVSPTGFVVTVTTPGTSGSSASTTTTAVVVSGSTTYSLTTAASATDLAIGECAAVFSGRRAGASGSAAPTSAPASGPVTAASVMLSAPVNGACSTGFGRPRGGSGAAAGSGSTGANA